MRVIVARSFHDSCVIRREDKEGRLGVPEGSPHQERQVFFCAAKIAEHQEFPPYNALRSILLATATMALGKRNEYLETGSGDDDVESDHSQDIDNSRTAGFGENRSKRRRLSRGSTEDKDAEETENNRGLHDAEIVSEEATIILPTTLETSGYPIETPASTKPPRIESKKNKPGIIYLSRLPPYLRPQTLRHLLSVHGTITNLFLTPEPPATYHHRVHTHHGNKKRQYIDGWVEFQHKRHAKACVDALNGRTTAEGLGVGGIGGRKGGKGRWYRDDVWSLKYLRGFGWDDLMQSARGEEREREERVRVGVQREKRERQAFLDGVQGAKIEETRRTKRKRKVDAAGRKRGDEEDRPDLLTHRDQGRSFRQNEVRGLEKRGVEQPDNVRRVLSKIF